MKTVKEYSETAKRDVNVDVDALLAAINEISESEIHRVNDEDGQRVSVDGREYHTPAGTGGSVRTGRARLQHH